MIQTKEIEYTDGSTICRGFLAYDDTSLQPKPCVLIAPDWSGRTDFFCEKAKQLAMAGYVGFAVDVYGAGKIGRTTDEKKALLTPMMEHRSTITTRMLAAFAAASKFPEVDSSNIAAIGYCFGGLCALDLARSGADVKGIVSFHGLLVAPEEAGCNKIRAKVLVLHGYDDPMVPPAAVNQFAHEMTTKNVDWQIHMYGHTQHAFTNPEANDDALGLHYRASADRRSWMSAELFLQDVFGLFRASVKNGCPPTRA